MPSCNAYRIDGRIQDITRQFYDILKKDGVSDAALDTGFQDYPDYRKTGEPGPRIGANDCVVSAEEVWESVVAKWQKYQQPMEKVLGHSLPWTVDTNRPAFKKFNRFLAKTLNPADREGKALAIYWWFLFPSLAQWKDLAAQQQKEILKGMEELRTLGLERVIPFLQKNGGDGIYYILAFDTVSGRSTPDGISFKTAGYTSFTALLYGLFAAAGLEPSLVELVFPLQSVSAICDGNVQSDYGVALRLPNRVRVFYPRAAYHPAEQFPHYPISLALFLNTFVAARSGANMKAFLDSSIPLTNSALDFPSNLFAALMRIPKETERGAIKKILDQLHWHPFVFFLYSFQVFEGDDPKAREALSKELRTYPGLTFWARRFFELELAYQNDQGAILEKNLAEILQIDPACHMALAIRAMVLEKKGELEQAAFYFAKSAAAVFKVEDIRKEAHRHWGKVLFRLGRYPEAANVLQSFVRRKNIQAETETSLWLWLSLAQFKSGDLAGALPSLRQAGQSPLGIDSSELESLASEFDQTLGNYLAEMEREEMFKAELAQIYIHLGDACHAQREYTGARKWYQRAQKILPGSPEVKARLEMPLAKP